MCERLDQVALQRSVHFTCRSQKASNGWPSEPRNRNAIKSNDGDGLVWTAEFSPLNDTIGRSGISTLPVFRKVGYRYDDRQQVLV